ncbi:hypothetical protein WN943_010108 [Citrus x changshan-huyou]
MVEEEGEEFDLSTRFIVENQKEKEVKDVGGKISALIKSDKLLGYMAFGHLEAGKDGMGLGLVWIFWLVATHTSVENKILQEIELEAT